MEPEPKDPFHVARVSPALGVVVVIGAMLIVAFWHEAVIEFFADALWGAPVWAVWVIVVAAITSMVIFSTRRSLFIANPSTRTITFRRYVIWFVPVSESSARFEDLRHIDLHHTGEHSTSGMPRFSEWLSPEHLPLGHRLYFNGLSPGAWIMDWILCGLPYSGSAEIRIMLNDRTEWKIMSSRSEQHVVAVGSELKRLTGARLT